MKKITYIIVVFLLIGIFFVLNKNNEITLDEVKIKENKSNVTFAMYKENNEGEYELITNTEVFPILPYVLNEEKSVCINEDGKGINNALQYDIDNFKVIVDTNETAYCYLYFKFIDPFEFDYTGGEQEFTVPYTGTYKLEVWGAQGGTELYGSYGGYAVGFVELYVNDKLYINNGGNPKSYGTSGYNGGGYAGNSGGPGGGATHIATRSGLLSSLSSYRSDILIVAGGGGGRDTGTHIDGSGGGYIGSTGASYKNSIAGGGGGTQTGAGTGGGFGYGGNATNSGNDYGGAGGGGYYGGGRSAANAGDGGGGSGFINSHRLISNQSLEKHMSCYNCATSDDEHTKTISNTCTSIEPTEDCSKQGNGYAKITYLGN